MEPEPVWRSGRFINTPGDYSIGAMQEQFIFGRIRCKKFDKE